MKIRTAFLTLLALLGATPTLAADWTCGTLELMAAEYDTPEPFFVVIKTRPDGTTHKVHTLLVPVSEPAQDALAALQSGDGVCYKGTLTNVGDVRSLLVFDIKKN